MLDLPAVILDSFLLSQRRAAPVKAGQRRFGSTASATAIDRDLHKGTEDVLVPDGVIDTLEAQ
jgi:hypothetical protein